MQKKRIQMSFSQVYVERRIRKNTFMRQIDQIIDWAVIEKEISKVYKKEELLSDRPQNFRYLVLKNYKIIYWMNQDKNRIDIVNVFNTRQNPVKIENIE